MTEFCMPKLGADMTQGRLVQWLKAPGDRIERGDIVAVIETDKANVEVESFTAGVFERALVQPSQEWLAAGTPLAVIGEAHSVAPQVVAPQVVMPAAGPAVARPPIATPEASPPIAPPRESGDRRYVSPLARRRARELGVALDQLVGSGSSGRIQLKDVEAGTRPAPPAAPAPVADKRARMREAIASAMARSKREIPHYYLGTTIDLARTVAWIDAVNTQRSVVDRFILGIVLIKAVALALREFPEFNGFFVDGRFQAGDGIHIGAAISLRGGGLIAPALLNTDQQPLTELMHRYQDLVQRARAGSLRGSEMTAPTLTVTSLGERGVETVFGIIYPPQVALVGFGKLLERPWVIDGKLVARPLVNASLSADHRASDGHRGGLFLEAIAERLQEPEGI